MRKKEYCTLLKLSHKHTHRWLKTDDSIYKYERKNNKKKSNPTFFLQIKYDRFFNALLNWLNLGVYPILIIQTFLFFCFNFVNFAMRYPLVLGWVTIQTLSKRLVLYILFFVTSRKFKMYFHFTWFTQVLNLRDL